MQINLRKARNNDLDEINRLTINMHNYLASLYEMGLPEEALKEEMFTKEELVNVYVAEDAVKGKAIGYMSFSSGEDEWAGSYYELEHIIVDKQYRGRGIGHKLFQVLLDRANRGRVNIVTGSLQRNENALRFYEELGFKPLSIRLLLDLQKRIFKRP